MDNLYSDTKNIQLERLEIRIIQNDLDILYRPVHEYLEFVKYDEDGLNRIKELARMSRQDFAEYLSKISHFKKLNKNDIHTLLDKDNNDEKWYQGAWSKHTKDIFKEINVENPQEEPIWTNEIEKFQNSDLYEDDTILEFGSVEIEET